MSLELNQNCQNRLVESIAEQLRTVMVNNEVYLDTRSMGGILDCEQKLSRTEKQKRFLEKYIGDTPLYDFIFETLSRDINENGEYNSKSESSALSSNPRFADLNVAAKRLIEEFNTLPWKYVVWYEINPALGKIIREHASEQAISDNIQVVSPDPKFGQKFPLMSGLKQRDERLYSRYDFLFPSVEKAEWNQETAYLRFDTEGFIGMYGKSTPIEEIIFSLKAFFGLCLALNILRIRERTYGWGFGRRVRSHLTVHKWEEDKWVIWTRLELPQDVSELLRIIDVIELEEKTETPETGKLIKGVLLLISRVFRNIPKTEKILLAGQWLLDSYTSQNELLSFVQTIVAMEILLGKKPKTTKSEIKYDIIGIGELLRNRCAYLIGKSHSEREEILMEFERIYDVRSRIVHRGHKKLTTEEHYLFRKLQWMCRRVIWEEIMLIIEDEKKEPPFPLPKLSSKKQE